MDKRDITIGLSPLVQVKFQEKYIDINPYISQEIQYELARKYVDILFGSDDIVQNYYSAEWHLIFNITDYCSSIMVIDSDDKKNIEFDMLVNSGLWDAIKNEIVNYNEFRKFLDKICQAKKEEIALQKSFGQALDKITIKVTEFIDKIGSLDFSEDGIAKLVSGLNSQVAQFKTDFPTSQVTPLPKAKRQYKKKEK